MREILGRRRRTRAALLSTALTCAEQWHWPVVPGTGLLVPRPRGPRGRARTLFPGRALSDSPDDMPPLNRVRCGCLRPDCAVPGAHPHDPELLAATTDVAMVRWWWTSRPDAPVILATGGRVAGISLPALAGVRALAALDYAGIRVGPVVASPTRFTLLIRAYSLAELGGLLEQHDWVPASLRYHGSGGYVVLPPSDTGAGRMHWVRPPSRGAGAPTLPEINQVVHTLVAASATAPDGRRLAY